MTITSYAFTRFGNVTEVTVTSDLVTPTYYWYQDGIFVGSTTESSRSFWLTSGDQAEIIAIDSTSPTFDPIANQPTAYPARRALWWVRSVDADVARYVVEQDKDGAGFAEIGSVQAVDGAWSYRFLSTRLVDLASYTWRVSAYDAAGNQGTVLTIGPEVVVRKPDAPDFSVAFNAGPDTVTYAEVV